MRKETIVVAYNEPLAEGLPLSEASRDVLTQAEAVEEALDRLGYRHRRVALGADPVAFQQEILTGPVDGIFNLCESFEEDGRLAGHTAALFELLRIPFTGSPSLALSLTTDKLLAKRHMRAFGIPTPRALPYPQSPVMEMGKLSFPLIVKPRYEDGSVGIDEGSVFTKAMDLIERIDALAERFGSLIVEEYIQGREFNVSLLGYPRPRVLPIAEIDFSSLGGDRVPILGYRAKWVKDSFEYQHTPRVFPARLPARLSSAVSRVALRCFEAFMLRDYARVDMRVDARGRVYVIDINANPCLSPDAGFAAACLREGLTYDRLIHQLVRSVLQRGAGDSHPALSEGGQVGDHGVDTLGRGVPAQGHPGGGGGPG